MLLCKSNRQTREVVAQRLQAEAWASMENGKPAPLIPVFSVFPSCCLEPALTAPDPHLNLHDPFSAPFAPYGVKSKVA